MHLLPLVVPDVYMITAIQAGLGGTESIIALQPSTSWSVERTLKHPPMALSLSLQGAMMFELS